MIRYVVMYLFQTFRVPVSIVTSLHFRAIHFRFLARTMFLFSISCRRAVSLSHPVFWLVSTGDSAAEGKAVGT